MIKYSVKDRDNNAKVYGAFLKLNIEDGWDRADKLENFYLLTQITQLTDTTLENTSILDVGCGTGDMAGFLSSKGIKTYLGVDIFEPSIKRAREKYPAAEFIVGDFLSLDFSEKFDFVFSSGALSTILESDNYLILKSWVEKMWQLSKIGICFNCLLENYPGHTTGNLFLYDRKKVLQICSESEPKAQIKITVTDAGDSMLRELHVYLYR